MTVKPSGSSAELVTKTLRSRSLITTRALLTYSTPAKLANLLLCEAEKKLRIIAPRSTPYRAIIDVSNACSLRCPYCPTGAREFGRKPGFLPMEHIEELMERVGRYLYIAFLYNWGEPLLHPDLPKIVAQVRSRNILTVISTNLNIRNPAKLEAVLDSGLDHLIVSIDGATQEVYSQYRVKGNLDLVLENLRYLVDYKRKIKRKNPTIEWQFLVFDHNRHEVEMARKLAGDIGVNVFRTSPGFVPENHIEAWGREAWCNFLWDTITMQVDGGIGACCHHIDKADDFLDSPAATFSTMWHAPRFMTARRLFSPKAAERLPDDLEHPCLSCPIVRNQPHLTRFVTPAGTPGNEDPEGKYSRTTNSVRSSKSS